MISRLLEGNRHFVQETFSREKAFFADLSKRQKPTVLWIGCSDSRVPVNTITRTRAGEVFTHRNVANIVATNDWNLSAVLEFSINHLNIPDIVICGHYGCGDIEALDELGADDKYIPIWLNKAYKAKERVDEKLAGLGIVIEKGTALKADRRGEGAPAAGASSGVSLRAAGDAGGGRLFIHGWVYDMENGEIRVLEGP